MFKLEGKLNRSKVSSDRENDYWAFVQDVNYPPGIKPNYHSSSIFGYILFTWVGKFVTSLIRSDATYVDYPPQPNATSVRKDQFEVFSVINAQLAKYRVRLSKDETKKKIPRFTLRAIFVVFWAKILLILGYSVSIAVIDFGLVKVIKKLIKSLSRVTDAIYLPVLFVLGILSLSFLKTIMIQHKYFLSDRYQLAITSSFAYSLFRLGVSKRKEYHTNDCGQGMYSFRTRKRSSCKKSELYMNHFDMELKSKDDNTCEQGMHAAKEGDVNPICPAQQSQGLELSNSIYSFFIGDTRYICKIVLFLMNIVEMLTQLAFSWYLIYSEVGMDYIWILTFQITILFTFVLIKFLSGFLKRLYLPATDRRIYSSYLLCSNIESIIMQGLEHASNKFLSDRRRSEARPLFLELLLNYCFQWLSGIVQQVSIATVVLKMLYAGNSDFSADKAITIIHTTKIVQFYILQVPNLLGVFIEAVVSMTRLDMYFSQRLPEKGPSVLGFTSNYESRHTFKLIFDKANFGYNQESTPVLKDIDLKLNSGDVLILSGHSASGKSSLIRAAMGELTLKSGKMSVSSLTSGRPVYYVPQKPWIPAGTFMSTVLDGLPFDHECYTTAITASELCLDVNTWEQGHDRTFDENATSLSGGQRMRLSLARMIYSFLLSHPRGTLKSDGRSDLVCIDGLFSCLDSPVSVKIFQNLFGPEGVFSNSDACVILTMEYNKLLICFQFLRKLHLPLDRYRVCELEDGEIITNLVVEDFLKLETPRSSRTFRPQSPSIKALSQPEHTPKIYDSLDFKRLRVKLSPLCKKYFSYAGPLKSLIAVLMLSVAYCVRSVLNLTIVSWSNKVKSGAVLKVDTDRFIVRLIVFTVTEVCTRLVGTFLWWYCGITAANKYHDQRINSLLFDKGSIIKPMGKYLTEFTVDQYNIDTRVHTQFISTFSMLINLCFQIGSIAYLFPYAVFGIVIINIIAYFVVFKWYVKSTRYARFNMLESLTDINLVISNAIHGGELIRAYGRENTLFKIFLNKSDYYYNTLMLRFNICNWGIIRYSMLNTVLFSLFVITPMLVIVFLSSKDNRQPGNLAYVLSLFITTNSTTCYLLLNVGLLSEYLLSLASSHTGENVFDENKSNDYEPTESLLDIRDLVVSYKNYDPETDERTTMVCINEISITAEKGDIIAIVGRTGSGKTSFLKSVRGMLFFDSGTIFIDGISIEKMSDDMVRDSIGSISQNNFYFEGWTLGDFIDPYKRHTTHDIYFALCELGLLDIVLREVPKLDIDETKEAKLERALKIQLASQSNYTVSTRTVIKKEDKLNLNSSHLYLISFVRLMLGRSKFKIILIDEPPNIEQSSLASTPLLLREFIQKYFGHCVTIIVTHDYSYVKVCSKLWVMKNGKINDQLNPDDINTHMQLLRIVE